MYLEDTSVIDTLRPGVDEVDRIFSHPLKAILDPSIVGTVQKELSEKGGEDWPYQEDLYNTSDSRWTQIRNSIYRMHRFRSTGSPIKGLTADILILAAQIGYEEETKYERYGPDQPTHEQMVLWAVEDLAWANSTSGAKLPASALGSSTGLIKETPTPPLTIGFKSRFEESTQ